MFRLFFLLSFITSLYANAAKTDNVSVQLLWLDQFEFAGFYMAKEKGFYREAGLDVEIKPFKKGTNITEDVVKGKTHFGIGNSAIIVERGKGAPIILLGAMFQSSPRAIAVKKSSNIKTINDLKHKRVMLTNDYSNDALVMAMLTSQGLKKSDFTILPQSYNIDDLINGNTDAMMIYTTNQPFTLKEKGVESLIFSPKSYGYDFYADLLYTSEHEIKEHPQRTAAFYEATMRGWKYAYEHIDESVEVILRKYNTQHKSKNALKYEANELKKLSGFGTPEFGKVTKEKIESYDNNYHLMGMNYPNVDVNHFVWDQTKFINLSVFLSKEEKEFLKSKKRITMCTDPHWKPFEKINANGEHEGIAADLIRLVSVRTGANIQLIPTSSWEESLRRSKNGECDILSFVNQTSQRDQWLLFTKPLLEDPNVIVTRSDHPYIGSLKEAHGERIALPEGTMLYEKIRKEYPSLKIIRAKSETQAMQMVVNKTADMTIRSLLVATDALHDKEWISLKISGQPEGLSNMFRIGVVKNEPLLNVILDKAIQTISHNEKEQIIKRHTALVITKETNHPLLEAVLIVVGLLVAVVFLIFLWNYALRKKIKQEIDKNNALKEEYYQQTKQAEIGNLIANISHQWREPLSKLSSINLLTMVKLKTGQTVDDAMLLQQSEEVEKIIDFMSHTMQSFLMFYKKSELQSHFSIVESIEDSLAIIETKLIDSDVEIHILGDRDHTMYGIMNEWMQVWLNIINNSLAVFENRKTQHPTIVISVSTDEVRFCDNAGGMKETYASIGLGHRMCRDIAGKYGAIFDMENDEKGLCVTLYLATPKV